MSARLASLVFALLACLPAQAARVVAVTVDGVVHPVTFEIISHAIDQARQQEASLLLIRLNTPGGMMEATRQIVERLVASPVPVVTYVTPSGGRAASAGFFLLEAGDVAAMAPGTNTGAASPVLLIGGQMDAVMRRKVENDAAASMRSLVLKRGRNAELAEKTVLEARSFTDGEALSNRLIELVARDQDDLLKLLDGREVTRFDGRKQTLHIAGASVVEYRPTMRESIISSVSDPNIAFILLVRGRARAVRRILAPGLDRAGRGGGDSGAAGPVGAVGAADQYQPAWRCWCWRWCCSRWKPSSPRTGYWAAAARWRWCWARCCWWKGRPSCASIFRPPSPSRCRSRPLRYFCCRWSCAREPAKVITGAAGMLGEIGVARTPLDPAGKVFVHGEYWDAESPCPVADGASVRVVAVEGLKLRVEPIQQE